MDFSNVKLSKSDEKIILIKDFSKNHFQNTKTSTDSNPPKSRCLTEGQSALETHLNSSLKLKECNSLSKKDQNLTSPSRTESLLGVPKADFIIENIVFKAEKEFLDQETCEVCGIDFSSKFGLKSFKKKFCLLCGKPICRICSKRKINGRRVCDLCLLRARSRNSEIRKKELLFLDEKKINNLKEKIPENKMANTRISAEIDEIKRKVEEEADDKLKVIKNLEICLSKQKITEMELRQKWRGINEESSIQKKNENKTKQEFEENKLKYEQAKKALEDKKNFYLSKLQEYAQLKKHREDMEKSESFVSMMKSLYKPQILSNNYCKPRESNQNDNTTTIKSQFSGEKTNKSKDNLNDDSNTYSYSERKSSLLMNYAQAKAQINKNVIQKNKCYPCT